MRYDASIIFLCLTASAFATCLEIVQMTTVLTVSTDESTTVTLDTILSTGFPSTEMTNTTRCSISSLPSSPCYTTTIKRINPIPLPFIIRNTITETTLSRSTKFRDMTMSTTDTTTITATATATVTRIRNFLSYITPSPKNTPPPPNVIAEFMTIMSYMIPTGPSCDSAISCNDSCSYLTESSSPSPGEGGGGGMMDVLPAHHQCCR